jgi:hypothetical protein
VDWEGLGGEWLIGTRSVMFCSDCAPDRTFNVRRGEVAISVRGGYRLNQ